MTSDNILPRLQKIDQSNLVDHSQLDSKDHCFYLWEYTARAGYEYGRTNDLISNIKKPEGRKGLVEYRYKTSALHSLAADLRRVMPPAGVRDITFVPVPPSKAKGDPLYDDRLFRLLRFYAGNEPIDVRELVIQTQSTEAARALGGARMTGPELARLYRVDGNAALPEPSRIMVVDDVLTSGAHFKAMQSVLSHRFPAAAIRGLFLARTVQL